MGHGSSWKVMGMVVLVAVLFAGQSSAQVALYVVDQITDDVEADGCVNLSGLIDCSLRGAIHRGRCGVASPW